MNGAVIAFTIQFLLVASNRPRPKWKPSPLRLSGGANDHEGNVEIYLDKKWQLVCDDYWDIRDAKTACRQLGFTKALRFTLGSHFPVTSNLTYGLDDVQCWGSESDIYLCWHRGKGKSNCKPLTEAAGVICSSELENDKVKPQPAEFKGRAGEKLKVRMIGNKVHGFIPAGFLEIFADAKWNAVCDNHWTRENSHVACGNLGYPEADNYASYPDPVQFSNYPRRRYWSSKLTCSGLESTLYECRRKKLRRSACSSGQPVFLSCMQSPFIREQSFDKVALQTSGVRLRAGTSRWEGRVEVQHMGRWGTVCDDKWNMLNANVVCRQMGFGTAHEATHYASFGQGSGKIWLDEVQCTGKEVDVRNCLHQEWGKGDCGHVEDAGVKCHFPFGEERKENIRIVGGHYERLGRVEVFMNDSWRAICGIGFGLREAEVACRQAGLGYAKKGFSTSDYGLSHDFWMFDVLCSGDEISLDQCLYKKKGEIGCRYYEMASVECTETAPDLVLDYKKLEKTLRVDSTPLTDLTCAHEENCLTSSADTFIHYAELYSRTLLKFTSRVWNRGTDSFVPDVDRRDWEWHQCHGHYHSMERFTDYDITGVDNWKKVAEGHKASFCLEDSKCANGVAKVYNCTGGGDQGISVDCADNYKYDIDCQWIDISDVDYGKYRVRVVLNPLRNVVETDYTNNVVTCEIDFISQTMVNITSSCAIEQCEQMSHGGTSDGACCKFPFMYKGKQYDDCTTHGFKDTTLWCSTTSNYDEDKLWGKC